MGDGYDYLDPLGTIEQELNTSVILGGAGFCGVTQEAFAINGVTHHWRKGSRLKIALDFDDLGVLRANQVKEIIEAQVNQVREATDGLKFDLFTPTLSANLVCKLARLDGPSGVLADCGIPPPNADPAKVQLPMRIDTGEVWRYFTSERVNGAIDFGRTWLHEFLHFLGLGHKPASISDPAIIAPAYNPLLWLLQSADKQEIIRRYGGKAAQPTPTPAVPTPGTPEALPVRIEFDAYGRTYTASGKAKVKPAAIVYPIEQSETWHDDTDILEEGELE